MRQIHLSTKTPDQSVDLGILLNGLPLVVTELKKPGVGRITNYEYRLSNQDCRTDWISTFAPSDFALDQAGLVKIIGQNHQFLGVINAIASMLAARKLGHGRGGVFWQTQDGAQLANCSPPARLWSRFAQNRRFGALGTELTPENHDHIEISFTSFAFRL